MARFAPAGQPYCCPADRYHMRNFENVRRTGDVINESIHTQPAVYGYADKTVR